MKEFPTRAEAVRAIVKAVNTKDADLYVSACAENVIVQIYDGAVRITGRPMLQENRSRHFVLYPQIRCEIQHIVEIGDVAILHDRVWLNPNTPMVDVVEIFTFDHEGFIRKIDVVQATSPLQAVDRLSPR